ncbi:MAG: hypothetical protein ACOYNC_10345 [Bacteroidales bacterium]
MKENIRNFLFRILIPGLVVLSILSAGFLYLNRHKRPDGDKPGKQEKLPTP